MLCDDIFKTGVDPPPRSRDGDLPFIINAAAVCWACDWCTCDGCWPTPADATLCCCCCCCCRWFWKAGDVWWWRNPFAPPYPPPPLFFNRIDPSALSRFNSPGLFVINRVFLKNGTISQRYITMAEYADSRSHNWLMISSHRAGGLNVYCAINRSTIVHNSSVNVVAYASLCHTFWFTCAYLLHSCTPSAML